MRWPFALPLLIFSAWAGLPRIVAPSEEAAFRQWFTFLAETQHFVPAGRRPKEIVDCAALVRFAYREALRVHDGEWARQASLVKLPALRPFPARAVDPRFALPSGALGHFADAKTLRQHNTRFVSRDVAEARPGDLLFFHQDGQKLPFHVMIFVGASHFSAGKVVVYHTGDSPGEIRRLTLAELDQHPEPRWRPHTSNSHFLGVSRWNLIAGSGQ
jgi:uncharacterized protein YfaT (DUF1175 family)